jgi:hypothetical protein
MEFIEMGDNEISNFEHDLWKSQDLIEFVEEFGLGEFDSYWISLREFILYYAKVTSKYLGNDVWVKLLRINEKRDFEMQNKYNVFGKSDKYKIFIDLKAPTEVSYVKDNNGLIIAGPLNCKDEILNACKNESMPKLIYELDGQVIEPVPTYRSLGKTGTDKVHDRLCFFDRSIEVGDWTPIRNRFFTREGKEKLYKGSYDTSKFNINNNL